HEGIYTVLDTGPKVQGRHLDLYMWSCYEALDFGRRPVHLTVLRLGWSPTNSAPGMVAGD
ncbi:MAG TPA: 3D domain-containing protein, partial [Vicinamibacterales bacterium]|nr:3D domain-containing protein [Vicinamibacterales bacterium]